MAQKLLIQMLDEMAGKASLLNREKNEAVTRIHMLEREVGELRNLISIAESKVDEMLNADSHQDMSTGQAAKLATLPSSGSEEMQDMKKRFPRAFTPD